MARQKGLIKLEGTIGDLTFYESEDGMMAKEKSSVSKERIAKDPSFQRTRENMSEFSSSAKSGKLLRDALRTMLMTGSDSRTIARLNKTMSDIKILDTTSARGARNVGVAIALPNAKTLLKGFNFNRNAVTGNIFFKPYSVNTGTGVITINNLIPINDVKYPPGATHLTLSGAWCKIDFATGVYDTQFTNVVNLPIDGTSSNILLTPPTPSGTGTDLFVFHLEFFQEVNSVQYSLKNGAFNALSIIEVV